VGLRELLDRHRGDELELYARTINPQFIRLLRTIGFDRRWARAEGAYLYDADGTRYLDMLGGFGMYNVGHNNPRVRGALIEALELDTPGKVQMGISPLPALLADALLQRAPSSLARVLFTNSGTETVEAALKLGRTVTGRTKVVSCEHGFHGLTLGSLSAAGDAAFTDRFQPLLPGFSRIPFDDLAALEAALRGRDVAVFIVEPVQGHGPYFPSANYLAGAQELCRRYGTLFCVDEVQTGLGRTGRMFALERWGLEPDLLVLSKALSGGYVPVGALLMSRAVYDAVFDSLEHAFEHGSTFAPNDLAMAAGLATLQELDAQQLVERAERLGELLLERTRPLVERYEIVKDVRGLGLLWAIEFQEPPDGSRSWRLLERVHPGLFAQLVVGPLFAEHKILTQVAGHETPTLKILPPLVLSDEDVDWFAGALEQTLERVQKLPRAMVRLALQAARANKPGRRFFTRA
jgi:ornithine--oxo-acid transaminase